MGFSHTHQLRVRYSECDMQGHVFNAHWLSYFDLAATELWRAAIGSWDQVLSLGIDLVVAEANVTFAAPARFDDEIALAATIERLGTTSIVTGFRGTRRDGELLARGRLVHVVVDRDTFEKAPIPDAVRQRLA